MTVSGQTVADWEPSPLVAPHVRVRFGGDERMPAGARASCVGSAAVLSPVPPVDLRDGGSVRRVP